MALFIWSYFNNLKKYYIKFFDETTEQYENKININIELSVQDTRIVVILADYSYLV
jgi:hypothetical protein